MLMCWSEQTELEAHRAEDTLDIKSVYSADFAEVHSGHKVLKVPERLITAETEMFTAHFDDGFTAVEIKHLSHI